MQLPDSALRVLPHRPDQCQDQKAASGLILQLLLPLIDLGSGGLVGLPDLRPSILLERLQSNLIAHLTVELDF